MPDGLSHVIAVASGWEHVLALKEDGMVVGWGSNRFGESVAPPGLDNVKAITAVGLSRRMVSEEISGRGCIPEVPP